MTTVTTTTTEWNVAVGTGLMRVAVGAALLRFRGTAIRLSGGDPDDKALRALFTYFGIRDFTLGVSALAASRPDGDVQRQTVLQAAADTTDGMALAALTSRGHLPQLRGLGLAAVAWGTAVVDVGLLWRLRHRR